MTYHVLSILAAVGAATLATSVLAAQGPSPAGLVLWLDAANPESAAPGAEGRITQWRDLSGKGNHLQAEGDPKVQPVVVAEAMNGKPVVRFAGGQSLTLSQAIRANAGSGMVLVVWQRSKEQASEEKWQRILSSRGNAALSDAKTPNFALMADAHGSGKATEAVINDLELSGVALGPLAIGRTMEGKWQYLRGDIAEILVYDRAFLSEGELQEALGYLKAKWNARVAREENGWTRMGGLGAVPEHTRKDLPLSDQQNQAGWVLDAQFTDEFDGPELDLKRWHLNPGAPNDWLGREPALFDPANVSVKDGQLRIDFRKPDAEEMKKRKGYPGQKYEYTSALVQSNELTGYGYYEARCKPMNSAGSSAFWFTETRLPKDSTEIDIFEIGGNAPGFERKYNMNAHVWKTPQENRHWAVGGVWNAPWRLADDFHVYGFEWNKQELIWYVDGVAVRKAKNTNWFFPMRVLFDSEAMWSWFGKVNDADLPSTFYVDYLRVWHQPTKP
jgi:beta-glucanase (GH16 family)